MVLELAEENVWCEKWKFDDAECQYYEKQYGGGAGLTSLADQISKAREVIQNSLATDTSGSKGSNVSTNTTSANLPSDVLNRITKLEGENSSFKKTISSLEKTILDLSKRLSAMEVSKKGSSAAPSKPQPSKVEVEEEDDDDDVDLFGSDDEEESAEAARVREGRLKAYAEKKSKKPGPIAKSSVLLDVKPWDDETDMKEMEKLVRSIQMDGLLWAAGELKPLAYGIMKLSILCIVEDDKVSIDDLVDKIQEFEDVVQSVDIGAFNKI